MPVYHPVPKELLTYIGDMTVSFALLELYMQIILTILLNQSSRVGHIISSQLPFGRLRAAIISMYKERYGEDADFQQVKNLMGRASKLEEERNLITHSIWGTGDTIGTITRLKITAREKRGLNIETKSYDATILSDFVSEIKQLAEDVVSFQHMFDHKTPLVAKE